jgi:hypothetical protein
MRFLKACIYYGRNKVWLCKRVVCAKGWCVQKGGVCKRVVCAKGWCVQKGGGGWYCHRWSCDIVRSQGNRVALDLEQTYNQ